MEDFKYIADVKILLSNGETIIDYHPMYDNVPHEIVEIYEHVEFAYDNAHILGMEITKIDY